MVHFTLGITEKTNEVDIVWPGAADVPIGLNKTGKCIP